MLTKEQFTQLREKGLTTEQIISFESGYKPPVSSGVAQTPSDKGLLRTLAEDPIRTLAVRPAARFAEAVGRTGILGGNIKKGFEEMAGETQTFGGIDVKPQKSFDDGGLRQIVGEGAQAASFLAGGATASQLKGASTLGKIGIGAKAGAEAGGLYSFGAAMEDAENQPTAIALQTLFGTATGAIAGAAIPAVGLAVGKTASKVAETSKIATNEATALSKLSEHYDNFLGLTNKQSRLEAKFNKDTPAFLANEFRGELPLRVNGGKRDLSEAIEFIKPKYESEATAFNTVLRNSGEYGSIDELGNSAKRLAREQFSGTDLEKALRNIDSEVEAFKAQYANGAVFDVKGKQLNPIHEIDEIKKYQWSRAKGFGTPDAVVANDTNFLIGKAAQKQIEDTVTEAPIKEWNKRLGDFAAALRIMESRDGLSVKSNFLNRITGRIIGGVTGASFGPLGSIPSAITGDWLAQQLSNPQVNTYVIKKALSRLPAAERKAITEEAQIILNQIQEKRASQLMLPAPTPLGSPRNPIITPAPTTFEKGVQRSSAQDATQIPTMMENKVNMINPTNNINQPRKQAKAYGQSGEYVYHGTSKQAFENIKIEGIKPQRRGVSSFSKSEDYSKNWAFPATNTKGEMLRVKADYLKGKTIRNNTKVASDRLNEVLTKETIPPEALEVFKDGKWQSLAKESPLSSSVKTAKQRGQSFDEWVKGYKPMSQFTDEGKVGEFWTTPEGADSGFGSIKKDALIDLSSPKLFKGQSSLDYIKENKLLTPEIQKKIDNAWNTNDPNVEYKIPQDIARLDLQKKGYSGAYWKYEDDLNPTQYQIWDKSIIKTRSQLKAEWNKIK